MEKIPCFVTRDNNTSEMRLYHHFYSVDSQRVRLALEEKGFDYKAYSLNPVKGRDLNYDFFQINPTAKMPVLANGNCVMFETLEIIKYIDNMNGRLGIDDVEANTDNNVVEVDTEELQQWMQRIIEWNPKLFTLSHIPPKIRLYFGRFKRRVAIARMAKNPNLADKYHAKLHEAYAMEDSLRDPDVILANERQLVNLLDSAEERLSSVEYLAGGSFTMADAMFIPILARLELLKLEKDYIHPRQYVSEYWARVKQRSSYRVVIGKHFSGLNRYKSFFATAINVGFRALFRRY